jgi:hypothetical protein
MDGFKATVILKRENIPQQIAFFSEIEAGTGLLKEGSSKKAEFETYKLELFERTSNSKEVRLNIKGSFHKNHQKGTNFKPFTFENLKSEILHLCQSLKIRPEKTILQNLEIGLNLPTWFNPIQYLDDNLLVFQNSIFKKYDPDKRGREIGFYCKKTDFTIKVYDKGFQFDLPRDLLRFEVRFNKMRELKRFGIATLADLTDQTKVKSLISVLEKAWCEVLIYDMDKIPTNITNLQRRFLKYYRSKDNWYKTNKESPQKFRDAKRRFKQLSAKYSTGTHSKILELIRSEWEKLFEKSTDFTGCQTSDPTTVFTDFTNTVKGEIREPSFSQSEVKRFCQSCGKDISKQRKGSKFCSETMFGPDAKRCRNKDSNPRNNQKKRFDRFYRIGPTLFDVDPYRKITKNPKR